MPNQQAETVFRNQVHRELSKRGVVLFRNNVAEGWIGASTGPLQRDTVATLRKGSVVIADARRMHSGLIVGSSDLIGWKSVEITPDMVGQHIAVFVGIETKVGRRVATEEQENFLAQLEKAGGIAVLARNDVDITIKEVCG